MRSNIHHCNELIASCLEIIRRVLNNSPSSLNKHSVRLRDKVSSSADWISPPLSSTPSISISRDCLGEPHHHHQLLQSSCLFNEDKKFISEENEPDWRSHQSNNHDQHVIISWWTIVWLWLPQAGPVWHYLEPCGLQERDVSSRCPLIALLVFQLPTFSTFCQIQICKINFSLPRWSSTNTTQGY